MGEQDSLWHHEEVVLSREHPEVPSSSSSSRVVLVPLPPGVVVAVVGEGRGAAEAATVRVGLEAKCAY